MHRTTGRLVAVAISCATIATATSVSFATPPPRDHSQGSQYVDTGGGLPDPSGIDLVGEGTAEIRNRLAGRFGGAWSDPNIDLSPTLHVGVVNRGSGDQQLVESVAKAQAARYNRAGGTAFDVTVVLHDVEHSEDELLALQTEVQAVVDELTQGARDWSNLVVETRVPNNDVAVSVDRPDHRLEQALAEHFAGRPVTYLVEQARAFRRRNASRIDFPPYIGGLRLESGADYLCTSGFVFKTGTSTPYYGSTAGHCEDPNQNEAWYIGSDYVGTTTINVEDLAQSSVIDALLYPIAPAVTSSKIYVSANSDRYIRRRTERADMGMGASICVTPQSQPGGYCGPVYRTNITVYIPDAGKSYKDIYCVAVPRILEDGDSGAPFYKQLPSTNGINNASASGMMSFSEYMPTGAVEECFVSVVGIETATGKKVGFVP